MNALLRVAVVTSAGILGAAAGCGSSPAPAPASPQAAELRLSEEPAGALSVAQVRRDGQDGQEVSVHGRIGGSPDPWVEGRAVFVVVDPSLKPCNERTDDSCPTPWDYCCDPTEVLAANKMTVELVDADGNLLKIDPRQALGLKELQHVVVHGRLKRDEHGNATVLARGVYVRP